MHLQVDLGVGTTHARSDTDVGKLVCAKSIPSAASGSKCSRSRMQGAEMIIQRREGPSGRDTEFG